MNPSISVVIPAFNEEDSIGHVLSRTHRTLGTIELPYEIVVVDDGSVDQTAQIANQNKAMVLTNGRNQGKGHALHRGFQQVKGDIIVTMDADGSHKPEDLIRLIKPILKGADLVFGSRFIKTCEKDATKKLHIFGNRLINLLILLLTRKKITDSQTGFRAFKRKVISNIEVTSHGYEVETELTVKCLRNGCVFQEEPVTFERRKDGCSHLNPLSDGFKILRTILLSRV